jgi:NTE family protein
MKYLYNIFYLLSSVYVNANINQLSFSGGGAFGAVEVGILKKINEIEPKNYDFYTGISAGALNAGYLSFYSNLNDGIKNIERLYTFIHNINVYELKPTTGISIFNTEPLRNTLTNIIYNMNNSPLIDTLIGATNLYSGNLDIFHFEQQTIDNQINLLLASSAIPIIFPPILLNNVLYADGGTLSNELLQVVYPTSFLNITYISPSNGYTYDDTPITNIKDMLLRTIKIVSNNFNDPIAVINQNCDYPIGEINNYFIDDKLLKNYNMMNFDNGKELINIGYNNVQHKKYKLC